MKGLKTIGLTVLTVGLLGLRAEAQQYYGYTVAQNQLTSLATVLAASAVGQPPGCAPAIPQNCVTLTSIGCNVTPCTPPNIDCPPSGGASHTICIVYCDQPPTTGPITLTITRNYYLPINIRNNQPPNVQPVDLKYQWQPIHYLVNDQGQPIDKNGNVLKNPDGLIPPPGTSPTYSAPVVPSPQRGASTTNTPADVLVSTPPASSSPADPAPAPPAPVVAPTAPAPAPPAAPTTTAANPPAAPPAPQVKTPEKRWVWLNYERVYGYGYQRADGYWVIDEGSRRATLPTAAMTTTASVR